MIFIFTVPICRVIGAQINTTKNITSYNALSYRCIHCCFTISRLNGMHWKSTNRTKHSRSNTQFPRKKYPRYSSYRTNMPYQYNYEVNYILNQSYILSEII